MSLETQSRSLSREEQAQQEHQRKLDGDPTRKFLNDQGFQGDSKVLYSMNVVSAKNDKGESLMGSQVFDNFEDLQKFIKDNPDALTQKAKDQMKEGIMPFGVGYDKSVYDWSGSLPTEKKKQMDGAWDSFGADNFDTRKWGSKETTQEQDGEKPKEAQQTQSKEELLTKARTASSSRLENFYTQGGILEGAPVRQEFLKKMGSMSEEELHNFDLVKARQEVKHQKDIDTARVKVMAKFEGTEVPVGEKPLEGDGWHEVTDTSKPETSEVESSEQTAKVESEKDKTGEKIPDPKVKMGMIVNNFVNQFRDGTVPESFREFIESNPTSQQYEAVSTRLSKLYGAYMKDGRAPSDKIPEFTDKLRDLAEQLNPDRLKFNDALSQLQGDLGNIEGYGNMAQAFESLYAEKAKPTSEQWKNAVGKINQLLTEYRKDKRLRSDKAGEWLEKIKALFVSDIKNNWSTSESSKSLRKELI